MGHTLTAATIITAHTPTAAAAATITIAHTTTVQATIIVTAHTPTAAATITVTAHLLTAATTIAIHLQAATLVILKEMPHKSPCKPFPLEVKFHGQLWTIQLVNGCVEEAKVITVILN